mmetsp:Transcript_99324/g.289854  ORF Transcript_99324/g.289854 Transcript_99324/m.289854 type:complete len:278 (-) Transcript_99324:26-859(-)
MKADRVAARLRRSRPQGGGLAARAALARRYTVGVHRPTSPLPWRAPGRSARPGSPGLAASSGRREAGPGASSPAAARAAVRTAGSCQRHRCVLSALTGMPHSVVVRSVLVAPPRRAHPLPRKTIAAQPTVATAPGTWRPLFRRLQHRVRPVRLHGRRRQGQGNPEQAPAAGPRLRGCPRAPAPRGRSLRDLRRRGPPHRVAVAQTTWRAATSPSAAPAGPARASSARRCQGHPGQLRCQPLLVQRPFVALQGLAENRFTTTMLVSRTNGATELDCAS